MTFRISIWKYFHSGLSREIISFPAWSIHLSPGIVRNELKMRLGGCLRILHRHPLNSSTNQTQPHTHHPCLWICLRGGNTCSFLEWEREQEHLFSTSFPNNLPFLSSTCMIVLEVRDVCNSWACWGFWGISWFSHFWLGVSSLWLPKSSTSHPLKSSFHCVCVFMAVYPSTSVLALERLWWFIPFCITLGFGVGLIYWGIICIQYEKTHHF